MLVGPRVVLRTFRETDVEALYDLMADVRTIGDFWPLRIGSAEQWLKSYRDDFWWTDEFGRLLLTDRSDRPLGYVNYFKAGNSYDGLEIGYRIFDPEDRGAGYMSEAVPLFVSFLFSAKKVEHIQALIHPENRGSQRIAEKTGFVCEGTMRRACYNRGEYHDLRIYSILREDVPPLSAHLDSV